MTHSFEKFNLDPYLIEAISEINFYEPTEIQNRVIPVVENGRDIIGQSHTGSGKTHSFLLPLFNDIKPEKQEVQVLITAPSRELAEQLYQAASQLAAHSPKEIIVQNYIGGTDKNRQIEKLGNKQPHIAIGTPGRLWDLIESNALLAYTAPVLVVDEADMTLDMGFLDEVDKIASRLPSKLQMLVFSATIPEKLQPFLRKYMDNPLVIEVGTERVLAETIDNWLISTKGHNKVNLIYNLLTVGQPYLALIFANTKSKVDEIAAGLMKKGFKVAKIHGDIPPRERRRVMKQVQNLDYQFVVATDLASRGIDIEGVSHVINAEIPRDLDFFIHRVGRTGRNNLKGIAITLYEPGEEKAINDLEKMGIEFKPKQISNGEIIDTYHRERRDQRKGKSKEKGFDSEIHGMVKKAKKNIKPNYKTKVKRKMEEKKRAQRKIKSRGK
ncbi:DEAD/DEAH box helicase [Lacticigenium naphthae]|uniref:DEAD/DEAH box helicase n=1 Tax=Lacticigenium naphthae TaxID=515351 RepID=UPI00040E5A6B|nr:DEAD/DEAH box helicase [Lacticigenium naphthae]